MALDSQQLNKLDGITKLYVDDRFKNVSGSSGTSGNTHGTSGSSGTSGKAGKNGVNGLNGIDGIVGINGENGIDGINGLNGSSGTSGVNGVKGMNGSSGTSGTSGLDGYSNINDSPDLAMLVNALYFIIKDNKTYTADLVPEQLKRLPIPMGKIKEIEKVKSYIWKAIEIKKKVELIPASTLPPYNQVYSTPHDGFINIYGLGGQWRVQDKTLLNTDSMDLNNFLPYPINASIGDGNILEYVLKYKITNQEIGPGWGNIRFTYQILRADGSRSIIDGGCMNYMKWLDNQRAKPIIEKKIVSGIIEGKSIYVNE